MRNKITALILSVIMLLSFFCAYAAPEDDALKKTNNGEVIKNELTAMSAHVILMDMKTGAVIYKKQAEEKVYPAALTNIMTALLILENCNLEELVTASDTALSNVAAGDSKMGIIKEEKLSVRQLLYGMLLSSASDAANLLAEKAAGSTFRAFLPSALKPLYGKTFLPPHRNCSIWALCPAASPIRCKFTVNVTQILPSLL